MIDFAIGSFIGIVAALATIGALWMRLGWADLWWTLGGVLAGYVATWVIAFIVLAVLIAAAFRPS